MHGRTPLLVALFVLVLAAPAGAADVTPPDVSIAWEPGSSLVPAADGYMRWSGRIAYTAKDDETGIERVWAALNGGAVQAWEDNVDPGVLGTGFIDLLGEGPPDGPITFAFTAQHVAGNEFTTSRTWTLDKRIPTIGIRGHLERKIAVGTGALDLQASVIDDNLAPESVTCTWDGAPVPCPAAGSVFFAPKATVTAGAHKLTVTADDKAGNRNRRILDVIGDAMPPVVAVSSSFPDGGRVPATGRPGSERADVTWGMLATDEAPSVIWQCRQWQDGAPPDFGQCHAGPSGLRTSHTVFLTTGLWHFEARASDPFGHWSAPVARTVTVTSAPGVPFLRPVVVASFPARGTKRGLRLRASSLGRATAELRCTGTGCRRKPLKLKVAKGRLDARPVAPLRFAAGQQVELRLAAKNRVGRVLRWAVTAQGATRLPDRCLTPGSHTPRGCWR